MRFRKILKTERLLLRPLVLEDAAAIQNHFNNWNIIKQMTTAVPWPYPKDGALTFLNESYLPQFESKNRIAWAITLREEPEALIGIIDYKIQGGPSGDRGFWLAEPFWGQGLMSEAVSAFQDHLFFDLGVERLEVCNARENSASRRIKEKTGARFLGEAKAEHHSGCDIEELWEIRREDWIQMREKQP